MLRTPTLLLLLIIPAVAQVQNYKPVTREMLLDPSAGDWLMYSRTYDAQRFSPLKQINKQESSAYRGASLFPGPPLCRE